MPNEVLQPINIHLSNLEVGREYTTSFSIANTGLVSTSTLINPAVTGFSYTANNPTQNLSSLLIRDTDDVAVLVRISTVDSEGHHYDKDLLLLAPDYYTQNCYTTPTYSVDVSSSDYVQSNDLVISTQDFTSCDKYEDIPLTPVDSNTDSNEPVVINFRLDESLRSYGTSDTEKFPVRISALPTPQQLEPDLTPSSSLSTSFGYALAIADGQFGDKIAIAAFDRVNLYESRTASQNSVGSRWEDYGEAFIDLGQTITQTILSIAMTTDAATGITWLFVVYQPTRQTGSQGNEIAVFSQMGNQPAYTNVWQKTLGGSPFNRFTGWFKTRTNVFSSAFGTSIAVNDNATRIIIGDQQYDNGRGAVFIFDKDDRTANTRSQGWLCSGKTIEQLEEMLRDGRADELSGVILGEKEDSQFGFRVACNSSGSRIVVGEYGPIESMTQTRAYEYDSILTQTWVRLGDPIKSDINYRGVTDVDMNELGDRIVVSYWGSSSPRTHYAMVYDIVGNNPNKSLNVWTQIGQNIPAGSDTNFYTANISSDGKRVVIGAVGAVGSNGSVFVYDLIGLRLSGAQWVQSFSEITGDNSFSMFGSPLALNKDGTMFIARSMGSPTYNIKGSVKGYDITSTASEPSTEPTITTDPTSDVEWTQVGQDIDGEAKYDESGWSVSLSADGQTLAIGAYQNDGNGSNSGHVRIYSWTDSSWSQLGADIDGEASGDSSGLSVSLSADGQTVAIGAYGNDGNGNSSGHVRIYKWTGRFWSQLGADIDGEAIGDRSGSSVSLSADGQTVAIGAYFNNGRYGNGSSAGHVRIYTLKEQTEVRGDIARRISFWSQLGADIDGEAVSDYLGHSVSLSANGQTVAIGAPYNDGNGTNSGHVRIYSWTGSSWSQLGADIDGEAVSDRSGYSVSLSDNGQTVAIGATENDGNGSNSGHVRIYSWTGSVWSKLGADIDGEAVNDNSGSSVSLSADGQTVAIGAEDNDGNGTGSGHVRIFSWTGSAWTQLGADIDGEAIGDYSGNSVSLSDNGQRVAIGAYYNDGNGANSGHVRVFSLTGDIVDTPDPEPETPEPETPEPETPEPETPEPDILDSDWNQVGQNLDEMIGNKVSFSSDGMRLAIVHTKENRVRIFDWTGFEWTQLGEDIESGNTMLWTASLSGDGDTLAIGEPQFAANGLFQSGRVRIFQWNGIAWSIAQTKTIDGEDAGNELGSSLALSYNGTRLAIGATGYNSQRGRVRIFKRNAVTSVTWALEQDIDGARTSDLFGSSVAISDDGDTIAVGAPGNDDNGEASGRVNIYFWDRFYNWRKRGSAIEGEPSADADGADVSGAYSQVSISADGLTVAIGARHNDGNGSNSGHVRIYDWEHSSTTYAPTVEWTKRGNDIYGEASGDYSGSVSLSADGNTVAIGAIYNDDNGRDTGHVRIFSWTGDVWSQVGTDIDGSWNNKNNLETGFSVSLSDDGQRVAIAGNSTNAGTFSPVKVFHYGSDIPTNWIKVGEPIFGKLRSDGLSSVIVLSNIVNRSTGKGILTLVLGERNADSYHGRVRIFTWNGNMWQQFGNDIDGEDDNGYFGTSVALAYHPTDKEIIAVGAQYTDRPSTNSGSVHIFSRSQEGWVQRARINGSSFNNRIGQTVALSENGDMLAIGSTSSVRVYKRLGFNWVWSQLGADIDGMARVSAISMSDDGNTIAIGDSGYHTVSIWSWNSEQDSWVVKGPYISQDETRDSTGYSVSLTGDGQTVAIGSPDNDNDTGCVRVYSWNNSSWIQLGNKIVGEERGDNSGRSVSLSDDGKTVAIGADESNSYGNNSGQARIYSYNSSSQTWNQIGADINGEAADKLGSRVYLTEDGNTVAISSPYSEKDGTAYANIGKVQVFEKSSIAPIPDPEPAPTPDPEPAPTPDPEPAPTTDPVLGPAPDPEPAPTPDPEPEPTPDPDDDHPHPHPPGFVHDDDDDDDEDTPSPLPEGPRRGYIVNGVNNKTITLVRGKKYTFDLDIPGHPMHIQTSAAGGYDPQSIYVLHSSMNGKFIGDYTFTVASDTPDTLWYQCRFHNAMQGRILIVNPE